MDILIQNTTDTNVKLIAFSFRVSLVIDLGNEDSMKKGNIFTGVCDSVQADREDLPCPSFCPGTEETQPAPPSVHPALPFPGRLVVHPSQASPPAR